MLTFFILINLPSSVITHVSSGYEIYQHEQNYANGALPNAHEGYIMIVAKLNFPMLQIYHVWVGIILQQTLALIHVQELYSHPVTTTISIIGD